MPTHPDWTQRRTPVPVRPGSSRGETAAHGSGRRVLPPETLERVLTSDRRRRTLEVLLEEEAPIALRSLVGRLADAEDEATAVTTVHERRQRVYVSLCRTHLPLLESYGLAAYDQEGGVVSPGNRLSALETQLEGALESDGNG